MSGSVIFMAFRGLNWWSWVRAPDISECLLLYTPHCALRFSVDLLNLLKVANAWGHVTSLLLCLWTMDSFPWAHYRDSICGFASKRATSLPSFSLSALSLFLLVLFMYLSFLGGGGQHFFLHFVLIPVAVLFYCISFSYKSVWKWFMAPACDSVK